MKPGIYTNLPEADYFAETGWVSSSELKRHLPEWFKPFNGSTSADFGSVFHERFTGQGTPVTVVDAATWTGKAAKEARATAVASGALAILSGDVPLLDGMEAAVRAHSVARTLLVDEPGGWEVSVFADVDGVPSKCRIDRLLDSGVAVDVKTFSGKPSRHEITQAVMRWGYELQETHYREVAKAAGIELESFKFLFVSKEPPHYVLVVELGDEWLARGASLRDTALARMLHPQFADPYEGADGTLVLDMPNYGRL